MSREAKKSRNGKQMLAKRSRHASIVGAAASLALALLATAPSAADSLPATTSNSWQARAQADGARAQADGARAQADGARLDDKKTASAEVLILHGTSDGSGIDEKLKDLSQLKEPPFSSYGSYKLLDSKTLSLLQGTPSEIELPNKGKFTLALEDIVDKRFQLKVGVTRANGKSFLRSAKVDAKPGKVFFLAGQKYNKGILVFAIRVAEGT